MDRGERVCHIITWVTLDIIMDFTTTDMIGMEMAGMDRIGTGMNGMGMNGMITTKMERTLYHEGIQSYSLPFSL